MARLLMIACMLWGPTCWLANLAVADVVVIANQTEDQVDFRIAPAEGDVRTYQLASQDQIVVHTAGSVELLYDVGGRLVRYQLDANAAYYFTRQADDWLDLRKIQLGGNSSTFSGRALPPGPPNGEVGRIAVKILVDDKEPTTRQVWEPRLRKRLAKVSDILKKTCRLELEIVAVGTWESSDALRDVRLLLREFQRRVDPEPARLAIGFSSGIEESLEENHLGGSPGLLERHLLISEWPTNLSEAERMEVLLHEIGHYLGAVHSPDPGSVMRPRLGDRKARLRAFRIRFDPVNTLILNLVGEELRRKDIQTLGDLSPATRTRLKQIYAAVEQADSSDTSARHFQIQLGLASDSPLANASRRIVKELTTMLVEFGQQQPEVADIPPGIQALARDRLTERCVQHAAGLASSLPNEVARQAFLVGLGIGMTDVESLLKRRFATEFYQSIDSESQRRARQPTTAKITILGRRDLAQHFFVSAALSVIVGPTAAEAAGVAKEITDARSGGHFSYADLAADLAGIAFAQRLLDGELTLENLQTEFSVADFMPDIIGLPETLDWKDLAAHLSGEGVNSLAGYRREILRRINKGEVE